NHGDEVSKFIFSARIDIDFNFVNMLHHIKNRTVIAVCSYHQSIYGGLAYATPRKVDDPRKRFLIGWIDNQSQVRQYILNLFALIEGQSSRNSLRNALFSQRILHRTRLGISTV